MSRPPLKPLFDRFERAVIPALLFFAVGLLGLVPFSLPPLLFEVPWWFVILLRIWWILFIGLAMFYFAVETVRVLMGIED